MMIIMMNIRYISYTHKIQCLNKVSLESNLPELDRFLKERFLWAVARMVLVHRRGSLEGCGNPGKRNLSHGNYCVHFLED